MLTYDEISALPVYQCVSISWPSPDGKTVAWGDVLGCVGFAEGATGREPLLLKARGTGITALSFLADGKRVASGNRRGGVHLWADELGKEPELISEVGEPVGAVESSPDGEWLAVAAGSSLRLYSLRKNRSPVFFQGHRGKITGLAFAPEGSRLISGGEDPTAIIWSAPPER